MRTRIPSDVHEETNFVKNIMTSGLASKPAHKQKMEQENQKTKFGKFHDENYKKLLLIPLLVLILSLGYIGYFYSQNNDFIYKDISLTGGTIVTITEKVDSLKLKQDL